MATDLTFQQLADALPAGAVVEDGGDVKLSISALTGDAVADLTYVGVIESVYKLLVGATAAQAAVNETAADGEALGAFGVGAFGGLQQLDNGEIVTQVNSTLSTVLKLDPNNVVGPNV